MSAVRGPAHRAAWLEIDLAAIRHNVEVVRSLVQPAAIAAVVKADAYGHGWRRVAAALTDVVEALCVATLDEAIAVRAATAARVLLLYPVPAEAAAEAIAAGVELTIMSPDDLRALQHVAAADSDPIPLQLCVETGLGRGGLSLPELVEIAAAAAADPRFRVAGLWSHLASPEDGEASARQVQRFEAAARAMRTAGLALPACHIASTGAIFAASAPACEMVRPGLALYGLLDEDLPLSAACRPAAERLRPAMSLKARPIAINDVPVGARVGYGGRWQARRPSRVAILPVGYADGYLRTSQPGARAIVRGSSVPLAGVISMDALAVDVTDVPGIDGSDEFVLLGRQGDLAISAGDLARGRNTIAWEVLTSMAGRLDRVYYP